MVQWLQHGVIDIYIDSPFIAAQVASETGAKPLLRRWKRGIGEYRSFLFTLAKSGLPHRSSPYGTGLPQRLTEAQARAVIEKVFKEEGYDLRPDYRVRSHNVSFDAQGYDPGKKVGFVFAHWGNLGDGAIVSWAIRPGSDQGSDEAWVKAHLRMLGAEDRKRAQRALEISDEKERKQALRRLLLETGSAC